MTAALLRGAAQGVRELLRAERPDLAWEVTVRHPEGNVDEAVEAATRLVREELQRRKVS